MIEQLQPALVGLLLAAIGVLGVLIERIAIELRTNTKLTRETAINSNGNLTDAVERLAAERNTVLGLQAVVRERDDRLAFILARHPEIESTLAEYLQNRTRRYTDAQVIAALQRVDPAEARLPTGGV